MPWKEPTCERCGGALIQMMTSIECADRCGLKSDFDEEETTKPDGLAGLLGRGRMIWNGLPSFPANPPGVGDLCIHGVLYRSDDGVIYCWDCGDRQ